MMFKARILVPNDPTNLVLFIFLVLLNLLLFYLSAVTTDICIHTGI